MLLCSTQNGHLVLWDVQVPAEGSVNGDSEHTLKHLLERRWKGKLHLGSVEGLAWQNKVDGGSVVTVGGDCIVNLFRLTCLKN